MKLSILAALMGAAAPVLTVGPAVPATLCAPKGPRHPSQRIEKRARKSYRVMRAKMASLSRRKNRG